MVGKPGPLALFIPTQEIKPIYEVAQLYKKMN